MVLLNWREYPKRRLWITNSFGEWYSKPTRNGLSENGFILAPKFDKIFFSGLPAAAPTESPNWIA